jgi:glycerate 2-kinase
MKIVVATDKFKGSLSSKEAGEAIRVGLRRGFETHMAGSFAEKIDIVTVPIADGGDGSAEVVADFFKSKEIRLEAHDPLGRVMETGYYSYETEGRGGRKVKAAFIEMAKVSGLALLADYERDPLLTSSYGVGELIADAVHRGITVINVSIGGSATNDGGIGMLQALGFTFYDACGEQIKSDGIIVGEDLPKVVAIHGKGMIASDVKIQVICDVTNPLYGPAGATIVYGPQKGAGKKAIDYLECGMKSYAAAALKWAETAELSKELGCDIAQMHGAGAAGGLGFALRLFLGAEVVGGKQFFAELTGVEAEIAGSDLVISGEGKIDDQSFCGKVIDGIINLAQRYNKPVALFCGVSEIKTLYGIKLSSGIPIYSLHSLEPDIRKSMSNACELLIELAENTVEQLIIEMQIIKKAQVL